MTDLVNSEHGKLLLAGVNDFAEIGQLMVTKQEKRLMLITARMKQNLQKAEECIAQNQSSCSESIETLHRQVERTKTKLEKENKELATKRDNQRRTEKVFNTAKRDHENANDNLRYTSCFLLFLWIFCRRVQNNIRDLEKKRKHEEETKTAKKVSYFPYHVMTNNA